MALTIAVIIGTGLAWLLRRQQPPRALLAGVGPYFWIITPVVALFTWMVLVGWHDNTLGQKVGIAGFVAFMWVLVLAMASPTRFRWAPRVVTGTVALAYIAYVGFEARQALKGAPLTGPRSQPSLVNALLGFLVCGVPAAVYTIRGRSGEPLLDGAQDAGTAATVTAGSDDSDA